MYIGNCITILDQNNSPFADATEMAFMIEDGNSLSKEEFLKEANISDENLDDISKTLIEFYFNNGIFCAYSGNDDVHYFFTSE